MFVLYFVVTLPTMDNDFAIIDDLKRILEGRTVVKLRKNLKYVFLVDVDAKVPLHYFLTLYGPRHTQH